MDICRSETPGRRAAVRKRDAAAPGGYSMAHASALYLIGPDGDWLRQYEYGMPAADILADLQNRLEGSLP